MQVKSKYHLVCISQIFSATKQTDGMHKMHVHIIVSQVSNTSKISKQKNKKTEEKITSIVPRKEVVSQNGDSEHENKDYNDGADGYSEQPLVGSTRSAGPTLLVRSGTDTEDDVIRRAVGVVVEIVRRTRSVPLRSRLPVLSHPRIVFPMHSSKTKAKPPDIFCFYI